MQSTLYAVNKIPGYSATDEGDHSSRALLVQQTLLKAPTDGKGVMGRAVSDLEKDHAFAEAAMGETFSLLTQGSHEAHSTHGNLLRYIGRERQWVYGVWGAELTSILVVVMAMAIEVYSSCPIEGALLPACHLCYSNVFLGWMLGWVSLHLLNLWVFVLLVSRGFVIKLENLGNIVKENNNRGIPKNAIYIFLVSSAAIAVWFLAGVGVLAGSNKCLIGGRIFMLTPRSPLLFWTILMIILISPVLAFFGRLRMFL